MELTPLTTARHGRLDDGGWAVTKDEACESMAHNLAALVHGLLWREGRTVLWLHDRLCQFYEGHEWKKKITIEESLLAILAGTISDMDEITIDFLAAIGWAFGMEFDVKVIQRKAENE
jgi:hypothetical protein